MSAPTPGALMSVALTEEQVRARRKDVTRRLGWLKLKEGDRLQLCRKVMGRKPGEPLERIAWVEVRSVRREPLQAITAEEVAREGFPDWTPEQFVEFFCSTHKGCTPSSEVTRIEWRYIDEEGRWWVVDFKTDLPDTREPFPSFLEALAYIADVEGCGFHELTWSDKEGPSWTTWGPDLGNTGLALHHEHSPWY